MVATGGSTLLIKQRYFFVFFSDRCHDVIYAGYDIVSTTSKQGSLPQSAVIGKIFVYKHCFCYQNVENVKQKKSLFHEPIVLWLAY